MDGDIQASGSGGGCLMWLVVAGLIIIGVALTAPDGPKTTTTTTTNTTSVLSNNELFSRNQVNLLSTVNNYFGANSGQTTTTATTNETNNNQRTEVNGDRNAISYDAVGNPMCWDDASKQYIYSPCPEVKP